MSVVRVLSAVAVLFFAAATASGGAENEDMYFDRTFIPERGTAKFPINFPFLMLDGGGLRGIVTTEVLIEVEHAIKLMLMKTMPEKGFTTPNEIEIDLADYFCAISGVSTGSWIAAYLATRGGKGASARVFDDKTVIERFGKIRPGSVEGLRVLFIHYALQLYPPPAFGGYSLVPRFWRPPRVRMAGVTCPMHSVRSLEATLDLFLGQTTLMDCDATLMVLVYDLKRKAAIFFAGDHFPSIPKVRRNESEIPADPYTYIMTNEAEPRTGRVFRPTAQEFDRKNYFLRDLVRASSASPTIFESKRFSAINDESFSFDAVDGGLMANNPTMIASVFARSYIARAGLHEQSEDDDSQPAWRHSILSIGMGISTGRYRMHSNSGAYQWFIETQDFLSILMDGGSEFLQTQYYTLDYLAFEEGDEVGYRNSTAGNGYLRIQTVHDRRTPEGEALQDMYNPRNVEALQKVGQSTAERYRDKIASFVEEWLVQTKLDVPDRSFLERLIEERMEMKRLQEKREEEERKRLEERYGLKTPFGPVSAPAPPAPPAPEEAPAPSPEIEYIYYYYEPTVEPEVEPESILEPSLRRAMPRVEVE